ncbi:MAG TPA: hypothetical protein VGF56_11310 [Rhizomicrobium sp.]|jgi:hypothetical protein
MSATTVVTDEAVITSEDADARVGRSSFSWGAALIGAVIAAAVTFFLVTLGSGIGLSLTTTPKLLHGAAPTFLTLGAVYFLAAQAFGFAAGAHVAGRLIGPAVESEKEEEFRAGAHGLGVWAIGVVLTVTMAAIGALVAGSAAPTLAAYTMSARGDDGMTPLATFYWVDTLFRGAPQQQASVDGMKFAQASSTTGTDAAPTVPNDQTQPPAPPQQAAPTTDDESSGAQTVTPQMQNVAPQEITVPSSGDAATAAPAATTGAPVTGRNVMADKNEAGRILDIGMAKAGDVAPDDRAQLATLVSLDTGLTYPMAQRRVDDVVARIRTEETKAAETARKLASYASLWAAFSLLFGAIVSVFAAISARWEDDRISLFGR